MARSLAAKSHLIAAEKHKSAAGDDDRGSIVSPEVRELSCDLVSPANEPYQFEISLALAL